MFGDAISISSPALTGNATTATIAAPPILAVKIDNYWRARPQYGLDEADAIIEENVEGVTRFVALFQTVHPPVVGPVRSARTGDLDLLAAMNRPVFAYSGANGGVMAWLASAESSGVIVDYSAQRRPCYFREPTRPGPHNLLMDPVCAVAQADAEDPGAARPPPRPPALRAVGQGTLLHRQLPVASESEIGKE